MRVINTLPYALFLFHIGGGVQALAAGGVTLDASLSGIHENLAVNQHGNDLQTSIAFVHLHMAENGEENRQNIPGFHRATQRLFAKLISAAAGAVSPKNTEVKDVNHVK